MVKCAECMCVGICGLDGACGYDPDNPVFRMSMEEINSERECDYFISEVQYGKIH